MREISGLVGMRRHRCQRYINERRHVSALYKGEETGVSLYMNEKRKVSCYMNERRQVSALYE
jgi:hypothetical protein